MAGNHFDIIIAGGGMVGATLALALRGAGKHVAIVEATAPEAAVQPSFDDRGIALSLASERILRHVGIWPVLGPRATPIRRVHVTEAGSFGCMRMEASRLGVPAFGHVVIARAVGAALWSLLRDADWVTTFCPDQVESLQQAPERVLVQCTGAGELACRALVVADGADSPLRARLPMEVLSEDYGQTAIVANVTTARPHEGTAYERFGAHGPLALLPLEGHRMVSVNCVESARAGEWLGLGAEEYCTRLGTRFGGRLGGFTGCGARRAYPLRRVVPDRQVSGRVVLLGAAALNIHPNGAQGFNVALRDVAALADAFHRTGDPGQVLQEFASTRREDRERVMQFSHGLVRAFTSRHAVAGPLRQAALLLAEILPPVKRDVMLLGAGLYGQQPRWVRTPV